MRVKKKERKKKRNRGGEGRNIHTWHDKLPAYSFVNDIPYLHSSAFFRILEIPINVRSLRGENREKVRDIMMGRKEEKKQ